MHDDGNVRAPALVCTLVVCVCCRVRGERAEVVGFVVSCCLTSALLLERYRCRCRSILGQHDPKLCDRQVIKLTHLQPVRETLGTCGWQSGGFSILASSSISSKLSLRYAFLLPTSLRSVLVSLVSHVSPVSHIYMSCELLRFICGQLLLRCQVALVPKRSLLTPSETCLSISRIQTITLLSDSLSATSRTVMMSCASLWWLLVVVLKSSCFGRACTPGS